MPDVSKDLGSALVVEASFYLYVPFGTPPGNLSNPDTDPTVTIFDDSDVPVIPAQTMLNSGVGQWFYNLQTLATWRPGRYTAEIKGTFNTFAEVQTKRYSFILN